MLPDTIKKLSDVVRFVEHLYDVDKVSFHPDDSFVTISRTREEALIRDNLMNQAFEVCEANKVDIYSICMLEHNKRFNHIYQ